MFVVDQCRTRHKYCLPCNLSKNTFPQIVFSECCKCHFVDPNFYPPPRSLSKFVLLTLEVYIPNIFQSAVEICCFPRKLIVNCYFLFPVNVAFSKSTSHSSRFSTSVGSENAVDGMSRGFNSKSGYFPHWLMIDLGETMPIVKLFFVHIHRSDRLTKMIITIGMYANGYTV